MADTESPTPRLLLPAIAATALVVALTGTVQIAALVALGGAAGVIAGMRRGSRLVLGIGVTIQFWAVVVAALGALRVELVLLASMAVVLCWDLGEQAITVADQLGATGTGTRPFAVHAAGTLLVGTLCFGGVYSLYQIAGGGQPLLALVLLLGGGTVVLAGTRI